MNDVLAALQPKFIVRRAVLEEDWFAISGLRLAAERKLRQMGLSQWGDTARGLDHLARRVTSDELYLIRSGAAAVGCFSVTTDADPDFWADDPEKDQCLYLHTVITAPFAAHTGVGALAVSCAKGEAIRRGAAALRLDCWRTNDRLRQIWEAHGFTYLRTVIVPGRDSGTLMEMRLNGS